MPPLPKGEAIAARPLGGAGRTPPSSLRGATAPSRGGLGKEAELYAMPRAPLLAGAVAAGDWGVLSAAADGIKPLRQNLTVLPPPLVGEALA